MSSPFFHFPSRAYLISILGLLLFCWTVAGSASAAPPAGPAQASGPYALDGQIDFNVLDQVEYDPQTRKLVLLGHQDDKYDTPAIPYLQYLATLLDQPNPEFSLNWTPDSERRVDELFRRLDSDAERGKLEREWITWTDSSQHVTRTGRIFLEMFGVTPPDEGPGNTWDSMDHFQLLAGIFAATNRGPAAAMMNAFDKFYRARPNTTQDDFAALFAAAGVLDLFNQPSVSARASTVSPAAAAGSVYRALFQSIDQAFNFPNHATANAFDRSIAQGTALAAAIQVGFAEFQRQLGPLAKTALDELWTSKPEIHVPLAVLSPSLGGSLVVQPTYLGIDGNSLLAKLMFDVDYTAKALINTPELAATVPGYQTERAFRRSHANSPNTRQSSARLWVSIDKIDASSSTDDNTLAFKNVAMRINVRRLGPDGKDLPNQQPGDYEQLLTSLYDGFAQGFSPLFHEFREAAKLAYAAQWLKSRDSGFKLPTEGRGSWQSPQTVPGIMFVSWYHGPSQQDVMAISAIGGDSLRLPAAGAIAKDPAIKSATDLIATGPASHIETAVPGAQQGPKVIQAARTGTKDRDDCKKYNPAYARVYVIRRTRDLKDAMARSANYVTMAVAVAADNKNCEHKLISGSEGDYLRPGVRTAVPPRPDEFVVDGFDHAERNIVSAVMSSPGWNLTGKPIGATRDICCLCEAAIVSVGAVAVTPIKPDCH